MPSRARSNRLAPTGGIWRYGYTQPSIGKSRSIMYCWFSGTSAYRSVSLKSIVDRPTAPALAMWVMRTRAGFNARIPGFAPLVCVDRSTRTSRSRDRDPLRRGTLVEAGDHLVAVAEARENARSSRPPPRTANRSGARTGSGPSARAPTTSSCPSRGRAGRPTGSRCAAARAGERQPVATLCRRPCGRQRRRCARSWRTTLGSTSKNSSR